MSRMGIYLFIFSLHELSSESNWTLFPCIVQRASEAHPLGEFGYQPHRIRIQGVERRRRC